MAEIGGRAAHIVDIALEILVLDHDLRLGQNGFVAAGLDDAALVEGQGAEGAGAEAAPVAYQAEFHLFNGRHATGFCIAGMPGPHIGQGIDVIPLLGCQRLLRRILDYKFLFIRLDKPFGGKRIAVTILDFEAFSVFSFV